VIPYERLSTQVSRLYGRILLSLAALLLVVGTTAHAADPFRVIPLIREDKVLLSFDLSDGFTDEVRDAIKSGLQTTITYTVELRAQAPLWMDRVIASAVLSTSVHFDNLTRRHTVVRTLDGRVEDTRVTEDDGVVKQLMTTVDRIALFRTSLLEPNREYYVRIRAQVRPQSGGMLWPWTSGRMAQTKFTFIP
jgi:Domain of unknown function (DUF4390)